MRRATLDLQAAFERIARAPARRGSRLAELYHERVIALGLKAIKYRAVGQSAVRRKQGEAISERVLRAVRGFENAIFLGTTRAAREETRETLATTLGAVFKLAGVL